MKQSKIFRTLITVIILSLLIVAIPATPVLAASLTINPDKGPPGTVVTVTGTGFTPGNIIELYFQWGPLQKIITIPSTGIFSDSFVVPEKDPSATPYPFFQVQAWDHTTDSLATAITYTMTGIADITISPTKGPVDTVVKISGEGLDSTEDIIIEYDGANLRIEDGDDKTDSAGKFQNATITIPESTAGKHTITVSGRSSGTEAEVEFTVEPEMTIEPTSGSAGSKVTISGTGFGYRSDITIFFNKNEVADDRTDRDGSFRATLTVPEAAPGTHTIEVEDDERNAAEADFNMAAQISINLDSGNVGSAVTVSGTGFKANSVVGINFGTLQVATTTANSSGAFSTTFNVPASSKGAHTITISDGTNTANTTFNVLTSLSIDQTAGNVGTKLTVTGTGFRGTVTIKYDDKVVATTTADSSGAFSATFAAPASTKGDHTITISDGTNTFAKTFTMESAAPPVPELLLPEPDTKAEAIPTLDWEDVEDPSSPVTYHLQVATDDDFPKRSIVLEKTDLTESDYTLTEREKLDPAKEEAPYYWRVKATDGASNESDWSKPESFYTGSTFSLGGWVLTVLTVLGAIVLFLFGMWVGRRTAYY